MGPADDHEDAAAIREKIEYYESRLERAELKREATGRPKNEAWHRSRVGDQRALGYLHTALGERAAARDRFRQAADHALTAHEEKLGRRAEGEAEPDVPVTPHHVRHALYAALLAGDRDRIQRAVDAMAAVDDDTPDELGGAAHYYYHPWVVAAVASGADDALARVETFAAHVETHDPSDAALYGRLLPVFRAIAAEEEEAELPAALAHLADYHARYRADASNVITRNVCRFLLRSLALAGWCGLSVDADFEYAAPLPWSPG